MSVPSSCPDALALKRLALGESSAEELERFALHLEQCERCLAALDAPPVGDPLSDAVPLLRTVTLPMGPMVEGLIHYGLRLSRPPALPAISGYQVLQVLGEGAMGVVYQALHLGLKRPVAIKIGKDAARSDEDRSRFRREAEAFARLQHPNIIQIFDFGEVDGHPFLVLELCPGGSLDKQLAGAPQPPIEAARLVEVLARAMQAAHQANVIHRDLKPANVLLGVKGEGRRVEGEEEEASPSTLHPPPSSRKSPTSGWPD